MRSEELRAFLLEYLKAVASRQDQLQYISCLNGVTEIVEQRCPKQLVPGEGLKDEDGVRLKHVIWDLILERILVPGTDNPTTSNGWPFLSVTDHGRKVVSQQRPVPYDPDGYLARLNHTCGALHPTVEAYLAEAIGTFRTGNNLASAVMLGGASEMVFIELCKAIAKGFTNTGDGSAFEKKTSARKKMVERVKSVLDWLSQKKSLLPVEWQSAERHQLITKTADLIRNRRNETGHPQDPPMKPSHEEMYALLTLFPDYCEKLYSLKNWLVTKKGAIP